MFTFIRDLIKFPFDSQNPQNKFGKFLQMLCKEYPAFLWIKPNIKKILVFPFLTIYHIFEK